MLCFWGKFGVSTSSQKARKGLGVEAAVPAASLCSPQPQLRGEPDQGEQQGAAEQPAGECWGGAKPHPLGPPGTRSLLVLPPQDDTCLAELALALSLSLEISSKRRLVGVRLGVRTLQAELHEGLFCSPLLHRFMAGGEQPSSGQARGRGEGWIWDLALLSLPVTLVCPTAGPEEPLKSSSLLSRATLQLVPRRVEVKLESTSVVLSMNSQKR